MRLRGKNKLYMFIGAALFLSAFLFLLILYPSVYFGPQSTQTKDSFTSTSFLEPTLLDNFIYDDSSGFIIEKKVPLSLSLFPEIINKDKISPTFVSSEVEEEDSDIQESELFFSPPPVRDLVVEQVGVHALRISFSPPYPGFEGQYVLRIGTTPAGGEIAFYSIDRTKIKENFNITLGQTYYVQVITCDHTGCDYLNPAEENILASELKPIGKVGNKINISYEGWDAREISELNHFIERVTPIINDLYGYPAFSYDLKIIKEPDSAIFIPSYEEIWIEDFNPQLLVHELLHAWRNDYGITSTEENWRYDSKLSCFEESFAQGVSYYVVNEYALRYPEDPIFSTIPLWGSSYSGEYDFLNKRELETEDFWSDRNGMGLTWQRYEMGAEGISKLEREREGFFKDFNREYYDWIFSTNEQELPSREKIIDLVDNLITGVEGKPTAEWIDKQHIFACKNNYEKKIWDRVDFFPEENIWIVNLIFYYETMFCGSDWACWDGTKYIRHSLNGIPGVAKLYSPAGEEISSIEIETMFQEYSGFGYDKITLTTDSTSTYDPWPGIPYWNGTHWVEWKNATYIYNMGELGLYRLWINFENVTQNNYFVIGDEMKRDSRSIAGGIIGADGGNIWIKHESYPSEGPFKITNDAFHANVSWAKVLHGSWYEYSIPGKVNFEYCDAKGNKYSFKRNVGFGDFDGSNVFLFDKPGIPDGVCGVCGVKSSCLGIDLFSYYPFDELVNGTTPDLSAYRRDGRVVGAYLISGKKNNALSFEGEGYVDTESDLDLGEEFTLNAWINPWIKTNYTGQPTQIILSKTLVNKNWAPYSLRIMEDDRVEFSMHPYNNATKFFVKSNKILDVAEWYMITAKLENGEMGIYINGELDNSKVVNEKPYNSPDPVIIGAANVLGGSTQNHFHGLIDEVRVYNVSLTDQEIRNLM